MLTKALLVRLEALPGKEDELADFLSQARAIVMDEPGTVAWFGIRFGPSTLLVPGTTAPTASAPVPLPRHRPHVDDQQVAIAANALDRGLVQAQQTTE